MAIAYKDRPGNNKGKTWKLKESIRKKMSRNMIRRGTFKNERNPMWRGDDVGYQALHIWIRRNKGKPIRCEHCGSETEKKYEWANKSHKYKRDLDDWIRLCTKCHKKYDKKCNEI